MARSTIGLNGLRPDEIETYKEFQMNASSRLTSAKNVEVACIHRDLNGNFFIKNGESIKILIDNSEKADAVVQKLLEISDDAGTCEIVREEKRFFGFWKTKVVKEESIADVNGEIQGHLQNPVVVTTLRALGIIPTPKQPASFFSDLAPERPSDETLLKAGLGATGIAMLGAGYYFRDSISNGIAAVTPEFITNFFSSYTPSYTDLFANLRNRLPEMPNLGVQEFFSNQWDSANYMGQTVSTFVGDNKVAVGLGVIAAVAAGVGIYTAVQAYNDQQEQQNPEKLPV